MRKRLAWLWCVTFTACASGAPSAAPPTPGGAGSAGGEAAGADADPRALPAGATFADLVAAARAIDAKPGAPSNAGCLLRGGAPARLEADVLAGARPLPEPPKLLAKDLDLEARASNVLSAWGGMDGNPASTLSVVAFTTTTPRAARSRPFVAFVTQRGVYLRGDDDALLAHPGPMSTNELGALLAQAAPGQQPTLYVTAEAQVVVAELRTLLRAVPDRYEVGLAVALPAGTQLPEPPRTSDEGLCRDGLPAPADDEPEGDIEAAALTAALAPLREAALQCATSTGGRASLGGKLVLALRIAESGRASELCFADDAIGELMLRRCLIESARQLVFPTPSPRGSVDVQVPLDIALIGPGAQRPLCD